MKPQASSASEESSSQAPGRKPYKTPRLQFYGDLAEITKGSCSEDSNDGAGASEQAFDVLEDYCLLSRANQCRHDPSKRRLHGWRSSSPRCRSMSSSRTTGSSNTCTAAAQADRFRASPFVDRRSTRFSIITGGKHIGSGWPARAAI